jgi:alanine racemase
MEYPLVKAQISLAAVKNNIHALKSMITKKSKFMAVVKADAYGHGAVNIAKHALLSGADTLGVARLDEAVELRDAGITAPLLVFGYIYPLQAALVHDLNLTVTIYNYDMAKALSKAASQQGVKIQVHLKIDTGMGRVGMIVNNLKVTRKKNIEHIKKTIELPGIEIQGIYTHLAAADHKERTYTNQQLNLFDSLLNDLKKENIEFEICHAANSAGILEYPDSHYDMVRAGISLYGLYPSMAIDTSRVDLTPAMTLKSVITSVRKVSSGFKVSYGMTHETKQATILASVPIGYADGFSRLFSSKGYMLVKGEKAPIVGRVCMDQTIIDVGHIPDVQVEDEVVLIGSQGDRVITADELAQNINTINYEIVSSLTPRVKRVYC